VWMLVLLVKRDLGNQLNGSSLCLMGVGCCKVFYFFYYPAPYFLRRKLWTYAPFACFWILIMIYYKLLPFVVDECNAILFYIRTNKDFLDHRVPRFNKLVIHFDILFLAFKTGIIGLLDA